MDSFLLCFTTRVPSSHGISKPSLFFLTFFSSFSLLHDLLSEPELGNNMSTIRELCKRLLSRRPNLEPTLSKLFFQQGTNLVVETSGNISNEQQCDSKAKENSSADVALVSNSKNSRETENKGKDNKSKKNKRGKKK